MARVGRWNWFWIGALALLAAFAAGTVEESFFHTDDGCPVEIHCISCQKVLGSTGITQPVFALGPLIERADFLVCAEPVVTSRAESPATPSRAPPLT